MSGDNPKAEASSPETKPKRTRQSKKATPQPTEDEESRVGYLVPAGVDATQRRTEPHAGGGTARNLSAGRYLCKRTIRGRRRSYIAGEKYVLDNNFAPACFVRIGE